ncbi:putative peptidoglycan lipid II flippase [Klenkia marina]|uniref:Putative peptidoglycan lipid II flippase n=1 Tax=Klenkia marina TaxID=1960309 RepID=A0A1G4YZY6_9ACTN|nr:murein biosynthesis integral membrane protein MurJ [Klenkia marina]SCX58991.1 putative peptidoglycan lipid II flippase [Klenkia marina]
MTGGNHRPPPPGGPASEEAPTVAELVERTGTERTGTERTGTGRGGTEQTGTSRHSREQPAARPARPSSSPLPPAPYGAVPPPLAAPSASALAGHPTTDDPVVPQQRPVRSPRRPQTDGSAPATRVSPLGSALAPPSRPTPAVPPPPAPQAAPHAPALPPPPRPRSGEQESFRSRFVPGPDDTQIIPVLPPVPATADDKDTGVHEAREGRPGGSRGILRAAGTMAVASLVSRITGLLRTVVITAALGVAAVNDAYNTANTLPNIVYELLLGGVLTSVVVPLLVHAQERDRDGGVGYAQRLTTLAMAGLVVMTGVAVLAAPLLTRAYGITGDPDQVALANWLARLLLVEIVFYGLGALVTAILNARGVFGWPAWAPVLNNVVVIATAGLFVAASGPGPLTPVSITPVQVWLLGVGTTLGIAVQALVLVPQLRKVGVPLRPRWGLRGSGLGEAGTLGLWVIGYVAISQVGVLVATRVANAAGRVSQEAGQTAGLGSAGFANVSLLFQMPYGIIGVALLTALVPRMSRAASRHDVPGVAADLGLGMRLSAVGLLPVTALLVVLGPALTTVAFGHGETSLEQARAMGTALALGAFGLLPMAVTLLQLRVFYAMKDARTPTLIQVVMVAVRVPLLLLVPAVVEPEHVVAGLVVATSLTYVAGWVAGDLALRRKLGAVRTGDTAGPVVKLAVVSAVAGGIGWGAVHLVQGVAGTSVAGSLVTLLVGSLVIGVVVVVGVVLVKVPEVSGPVAAVRARLGGARR